MLLKRRKTVLSGHRFSNGPNQVELLLWALAILQDCLVQEGDLLDDQSSVEETSDDMVQ